MFIAGESYGGYRVGRLARVLQETAGIGLNGAILISPALEITGLQLGDYDVLGWVDRVPTMAAAAAHHGKSRAFRKGTTLERILRESEDFSTGDYATFLTRGASIAAKERTRILTRLADLVGLPTDIVLRAEGRVGIFRFVRELLRDERKVLGLYDTTITATDPFPDRDEFTWPDPTLSGISPAYTMAVNRMLRSEIGVETDREYTLLSYEVNTAWKNDTEHHAFAPPPGATDDFRYGMALNPHMKAFITHGQYDLVTPYFASDRLRNLMRLDPQMADRLTVQHFGGGHMFYAWETSRKAFTAAIAAFVADATLRTSDGVLGDVRGGEPLGRLDEPGVLETLAKLIRVDAVEPDLHAGPAVVVRAREVDVGVRVEDELLLVAVDADGEPAAVSLPRGPGEELAPDAKGGPVLARLLDFGERERKLVNRRPVNHGSSHHPRRAGRRAASAPAGARSPRFARGAPASEILPMCTRTIGWPS